MVIGVRQIARWVTGVYSSSFLELAVKGDPPLRLRRSCGCARLNTPFGLVWDS